MQKGTELKKTWLYEDLWVVPCGLSPQEGEKMLVGQLEKTACDIYGTSANRQRGRYHDSTYGKDNDEVNNDEDNDEKIKMTLKEEAHLSQGSST